MRIFIREVFDFVTTELLTYCFDVTYSPPRPHSPQDDGQIIFDVDVTGRRDSQVRAHVPLRVLRQSVAMATSTTGHEVAHVNDNCCLPLVSMVMAVAPSVDYRLFFFF